MRLVVGVDRTDWDIGGAHFEVRFVQLYYSGMCFGNVVMLDVIHYLVVFLFWAICDRSSL